MTRALAALALLLTALAGAQVGYTLALAWTMAERADRVELHAETDARMRTTAARAVVWAERWREMALVATEAKVGPTGE